MLDFIPIPFLVTIILYLVVFISITILRNPMSGIILLVIIHFWFGSIEAGVYPRILAVLYVTALYLAPIAHRRNLTIECRTKNLLCIAVLFLLWACLVNQVVHHSSSKMFINLIAKVGIPILLAYLIYIIIQKPKDFYLFLTFLIIVMAVSSTIAVLQYGEVSLAWEIRKIQGEVLYSGEPAGLALFVLLLSYQLTAVIPLNVSLLQCSKNVTYFKRFKYLFIASLILCILALFTTKVRSAIAGVIIGTMVTMLLVKQRRKAILIGLISILLLFPTGFKKVLNSSSSYREITSLGDESASARKPLFLTGLEVILHNPFFGVGLGNYEKEVMGYYGEVCSMYGVNIVGTTTAHNQFINIAAFYGFFGIALLLTFYFSLFNSLFYFSKRSSDWDLAPIAAGLLGTQTSYIVNSLFHNTGPFISDPYVWFYIGASFVLFKFATQEQQSDGTLSKCCNGSA